MKHFFLFFIMQLFVLTVSAQYVDLGLPSGTKWKTHNEPGFYTYYEAIKFGDELPTFDQWGELHGMCDWTWVGSAYKVVGPNGNFIKLPAAGGIDVYGKVNSVGIVGSYWSSTLEEDCAAHCIGFAKGGVLMFTMNCNGGISVRLVQSE